MVAYGKLLLANTNTQIGRRGKMSSEDFMFGGEAATKYQKKREQKEHEFYGFMLDAA